MNFFKYNRAAAIAALVLIVILCVPLGTMRSVSALAGRTEDAFADTGAQSDLAKYVSHAENFAAAYEAVCGSDSALRDAIRALRAVSDTPFLMTDEMETLSALAANAYYKASLADGADESVKNSLIAYYYEMQSDEMRLAKNTDYNQAADKYNGSIDAFPASLFCPRRQPAVTFG